MKERHRKMIAAMKTLREIFNEDSEVELEVVLLVCRRQGSTASDFASSITDRRRTLAVLRDQVTNFEHQLGDAA